MKRTIQLLLLLLFIFSPLAKAQTQLLNPLMNITPQVANVHDGAIEYFEFGHGSPIVLISGYAVNVSSWDSRFLAALAQQHTVIIFDNRNVGDTTIHSNSYHAQDLANDLFELLQQLHIQKTTVLGFSMGGMIAQEFAVLHPELISHLILLNTAIAGDASVPPEARVKNILFHLPENRIFLYAKTLKLFFPPKEQIRMALTAIHYHFKPQHHFEKQATKAVLMEQQALLMEWQKDNATKSLIEKINLPVLVLSGGADIVIPPANSNVLSKEIPHATLLRWPGGGHGMIYQYPHELAAAVCGFVGRG